MRQSPSPAHRPRRKLKPTDSNQALRTPSPVYGSPLRSRETANQPTFPLLSFLWPARSNASRWTVLPLILIFAGLFRWTTGLWDYSGFNAPPLYGDFEAQRHWMEITTGLPISQWYFHELQWWGLDYPPLTAYHSWVCGKLGSLINRTWFGLRTSRGLESQQLKVFMRGTVIISEYLVYIPALVIFVRSYSQRTYTSTWQSYVALTATLFQPATILVDHGHFQYNTVMLAFVVASLACMITDHLLWSCGFFVAALGFKQMALYYAPTVFAYSLGSCVKPRVDLLRLSLISLATIISFAMLYAPLILGMYYDRYRHISMNELEAPPILQSLKLDQKAFYYPALLQFSQSIHRVFPFQRGLFEDKVANFWCSLHTFHKLHKYSKERLQQVSLLATLVAVLPPSLVVGVSTDGTKLPMAFAASAWGFFLFSFQVHEKSVLLPLLPMTLFLANRNGLDAENRAWVSWANTLGSWTLFPLLKREGLRMPYAALTLLWTWLMGQPTILFSADQPSTFTQLLHGSFYIVMVVWHIAEHFIAPPENKPDLWLVANVLIGFAGFFICYLWSLWQIVPDSVKPQKLQERSLVRKKASKKAQ